MNNSWLFYWLLGVIIGGMLMFVEPFLLWAAALLAGLSLSYLFWLSAWMFVLLLIATGAGIRVLLEDVEESPDRRKPQPPRRTIGRIL